MKRPIAALLALACTTVHAQFDHVHCLVPPAAGRSPVAIPVANHAASRGTPSFAINSGLGGSWFDPATAGQGFLIDVIPSQKLLFVAWFTHASLGPADDTQQRWLTAQGAYSGDAARLTVFLNRGGRFDSPPPPDPQEVGTLSLRFTDCTHATATYAVRENAVRGTGDATGGSLLTGEIALQRLSPDVSCAELASAGVRATYAIVGANVLPMDSERVLAHHTVIVDGANIATIGPDGSVPIAPGAIVINAEGRWLMPGLTDFHTHERALPDWPADEAGNFIMMLANGITSIVNMGDFTGAMVPAGAAVRRGDVPGPEVYAGYFARGPADGSIGETLVRNATDGRALAQRAHEQGYDFIKSYDAVPAAGFDALVTEGRARGLPVLGHTNAQLSLDQALRRGQGMVVHALSVLGTGFGGQIAPASVPAVAASFTGTGAALSPTLHVTQLIAEYGLDAIAGRDPWQRVIAQPGVEYMDDGAIDAWLTMLAQRSDIRQPIDRRPWQEFMRQFSRAFHDAGVLTLMGTDEIGIPGVVPGFAIHGEIAQLRLAGLTPFQTLATGTRNAGAFIRARMRPDERFGTVESGARADLLLLADNPLENLDTLRRPSGVMAAGRWYPGAWLRDQLELLRAR